MSVVDAMIQTLAQQVFTALMNQAQFALDCKGQFEQMKTRLDLMKAFLTDTENLKRKNEVAKAALTKLREVIYEAENVLTDCIIRDEYKKDGSCFGLSIDDPFFLHQTGKRLKDINMRMEQIEKSLGSFLKAPDSVHSEDTYQVKGFISQDCNPSEIIGLEADLKKIKGWILDTKETLLHIAIVGMGGLGKTTLAQKIFHDNEVLSRFDKIIWVCVSKAFSEEKIVRCMLERLGKNVSGFGGSQLLSELQQVLADKTCLIVMDDVWQMTNVEWWTNLCSILPKRDGKSSCIIITTRNEGVANDMGVEPSRIHWPNTLNDAESWSLFSKFAFSSSKGICPNSQFEELGKEFMKKCGGLPLAIKTIGALLAPKIESPAEWNHILESFHERTTEGWNNLVMASLGLSYDELPTHLKLCLLSFSLYPEDSDIRTEQLIHWWIGEGLVQGKGSKSAIEMGYEFLSELIKRCLVDAVQQRRYDGRVYNCKMHDMVRELIIMNAEEESFCSFDEQGRQILTAGSRWIGFSNAMHGESLRNRSKIRALLVMSSGEKLNFVNFGLLRSLRVLDFSYSSLKEINIEDLFKWISSLKRLAHLNLTGVQGLEVVPSSIRKLLNLQLLVLTRCTNLKKINPSVTSLRRLIVLNLACCPLDNLPRGLGRLSYLQELSGFIVASQSKRQCCQLLELRELKDLRVLRISLNDDAEISENEQNILADLKHLKVLDIDVENCKKKNKEILEMVDRLNPPPILQELYLKNYHRETLPKWVSPSQLKRLQFLSIENGELINLTAEVEDSNCHSSWNIEGLCLKFLTRLQVDWEDLQKNMPVLRYMEVSHCYKLKGFPCPVKSQGVWRKNQDSKIDSSEGDNHVKESLSLSVN
ncbi:hypothetical protein FNV43_RR07926 [Rhamnella rubrinervis]|uniref:Disease resistance RPP13-like protein 4 n=1 Tax=Rhamnella rubrinervis TaxID=2594499 RepID=A0A8K0HHH4_9ROSA|nr:hypothetical protein FNV43_RR07926 [Rhamnella rubrinervis]